MLPLSSARASATAHVSRRVLALYYPWYGTPNVSGQWRHQSGVNRQAQTMAGHAHYPLSGPYDSLDPALIDRHLRQAKTAGIDTLVCSWWGQNDPTDRAIRMLLKQASTHGMTICILWELGNTALTPQTAQSNLTYLLDTFGKQPGYLRNGGKPVVFLYSKTSDALTPEQWTGVLNAVSRQQQSRVLTIADSHALMGSPSRSGFYSLDLLSRMEEMDADRSAELLHLDFQARLPLQRKRNLPSIETIGPGYDDRRYSQKAGQAPGPLVNRLEGQRYARLWEQALRDSPDWVLINSFNEWHNGTEIEPSHEFGDQYLRMTRRFAQSFKSGTELHRKPSHVPTTYHTQHMISILSKR